MQPDLRFWFDPVCPFAWLTSRWVEEVRRQQDYVVEYRLISLRLLNSHIDYDAHFPEGYEAGHTAGLHMLRVAAAARDAHGPAVLGGLYTALGTRVWDVEPPEDGNAYRRLLGDRATVEDALAEAGLPTALADALDEAAWDRDVQQDTDLALSLTGTDVGTPILQADVPDGPGFFGPVISEVPPAQDAVRLWEHVVGLSTFPAFAELKRSLRSEPRLRVLGTLGRDVEEQDWHAGSRAEDRPEGAGRP